MHFLTNIFDGIAIGRINLRDRVLNEGAAYPAQRLVQKEGQSQIIKAQPRLSALCFWLAKYVGFPEPTIVLFRDEMLYPVRMALRLRYNAQIRKTVPFGRQLLTEFAVVLN